MSTLSIDDIIGAVNRVIEQIEDQRQVIKHGRAAVLKEEPSFSGMGVIASHAEALNRLRLAEDVLSDAVTELQELEDRN